jgi:hypothetical protein
MNNKYTTRLTDDNYVRPTKTNQDMMTQDEIEALLIDYEPVDDVNSVALNSHLRYYTTTIIAKKKVKKFRRGGILTKNDPKEPYIILSNGTKSWSVQKKTSLFFRKKSFDEIKGEYIAEIDSLKADLSKAEKMIRKYSKINKQLKEELNRLGKKSSKKSSRKR